MEEEWRDIKGYEGKYQVSNLGRVKSCERDILHIRKSTGKTYITHAPEIILSLKCDSAGYPSVMLYSAHKVSKRIMVHLLVAREFIPNPNNLPQVNHKDEDKTNNCVDNLEWCTRKYNMNYGTVRQRISATKRERMSDETRHKLSEATKAYFYRLREEKNLLK